MIIDTDVMIWFLRGNKKALEVVNASMPFSISIITYMELVQGVRDKQELSRLKKALNEMDVNVIPITESISIRASEYVEQFFLNNSMELADALIASSCVEQKDSLMTANDKHYKVVDDLKVEVFRP